MILIIKPNVSGLTAMDILTAIRNSNGPRPALFVPEVSGFVFFSKTSGSTDHLTGQLRVIGQETDQAAGGAKSPLCRTGPRGDAENHPALW